MENLFLKKIDNYIKENGIPFKSIYISTNYFPKSFNDAIFNKILRIKDIDRDEKIENYELYYNDGILQLIARDTRDKATLVIYDRDMGYSYTYPCYKMREEEIVDKAIYLESKVGREVLSLIREVGLSDRCNFSIFSIYDTLDKVALECCSYIEYLNNLYQDMLKEEAGLKYLEIKYQQPEVSTMIKKGYNLTGLGTKERANALLPIDDRKNVLESYDYIYSGYAYSSSNKKIEYLCYLYNIDVNQYAVIMEPMSGLGYTKTYIFNYDEDISSELFIKMVSDKLSLSYEDSLDDGQIVMTKHTSYDLFTSTVENIVLGTDLQKRVHAYTKNKIRDMKVRGE